MSLVLGYDTLLILNAYHWLYPNVLISFCIIKWYSFIIIYYVLLLFIWLLFRLLFFTLLFWLFISLLLNTKHYHNIYLLNLYTLLKLPLSNLESNII